MDVDDTDRRIVNALLADGRANVRDLSAATGVSVPVVEQRLDALERAGIVGDPEPVVDYEALGYDVTAVLRVNATRGEEAAVTDRLAAKPNVTTVYAVTGEFDAVAVGKYTTVGELNEHVGSLLTADAVRTVTTQVVRETVEEGTQFPLPTDDD